MSRIILIIPISFRDFPLASFFTFWSSENHEGLVRHGRVTTKIMEHKGGEQADALGMINKPS